MAADPYAIDAAFYDAIHGDGGDDLDFWLPLVAEHGGPVLEVGAGTGRIALPLARAAHAVAALDPSPAVAALDPSPAMLAIARQRAAEEGLAVTFVDGRLPGAELPPAAFATVILPNDVFLACASEDEQVRALRAASTLLAPRGRLALDVAGPGHWLDPDDNGEPILAWSGDAGGERLEVWHVRHDDLATQTRRLRIRYEVTVADGQVRQTESEHVLRYVTLPELTSMLDAAGLRVLDTWGDYLLGALTNASERLIVTAELVEGAPRRRVAT
ncbi:MAG: class I SAM-dependent methyltransferase [Chloroflexi bacterium]|nr:class I SAM-dependent methyltransferase [Chloroflexota bacterium]